MNIIFMQQMVQMKNLFLLNNEDKINTINFNYGGAKCPKFNLVGPVECNNLLISTKNAMIKKEIEV